MEVAEDSVAKRVLREHVRESLGVRNDDLLFAIINSMSLPALIQYSFFSHCISFVIFSSKAVHDMLARLYYLRRIDIIGLLFLFSFVVRANLIVYTRSVHFFTFIC